MGVGDLNRVVGGQRRHRRRFGHLGREDAGRRDAAQRLKVRVLNDGGGGGRFARLGRARQEAQTGDAGRGVATPHHLVVADRALVRAGLLGRRFGAPEQAAPARPLLLVGRRRNRGQRRDAVLHFQRAAARRVAAVRRARAGLGRVGAGQTRRLLAQDVLVHGAAGVATLAAPRPEACRHRLFHNK